MKKVILLYIFLSCKILLAANYYVDPINGSMDNDGTSEYPWSTLDSVMFTKSNLFAGGDTIFVRSGYHGDRIWIGANPSSPITIIAEKNSSPLFLNIIIDGSNWILDGLIFTQDGNDGIGTVGNFTNGTHLSFGKKSRNNVVQNCNFYSIEDASNWSLSDWRNNVWSGIIDYGKSNIIRNNHLYNIAFAIQLTEVCDSAIVEHNVIENFSGDGIRIGGADYCRVESNIIKNSIELDPNPQDGNHEDGIQAWDFDDGVNGLIIRGNYILNYENLDQPFRGILQGMGFFDGFYNNCIIENNIVIVEHWHGISLYGAKDTRIVNNTVLPNPGGSRIAGPPWIGIFPHKDGRQSTGNVVRNNLTAAADLAGSGSINDHNIVDMDVQEFCIDYDNFDFYPKSDFTLNGKSIIDVGSPELAPDIDFNGTSRPQGEGYDIGAYEYTDSLTNIFEEPLINIESFYLFQNYPNPFNPTTTIKYTINVKTTHELSQPVTLKVYNVLGKEIITLVNGNQAKGNYEIEFDASSVSQRISSGIYFYKLKIGKLTQTKKMILLQ